MSWSSRPSSRSSASCARSTWSGRGGRGCASIWRRSSRPPSAWCCWAKASSCTTAWRWPSCWAASGSPSAAAPPDRALTGASRDRRLPPSRAAFSIGAMRRYRCTKIVATLGPASSTEAGIRALFAAGVDVFRFNFSHGSHADHQERFDIVRRLEAEAGRPISVMADLQGPKLRVGTFPDGPIRLEKGAAFRLELKPGPGNAQRATLPHPEIFAAIGPGTDLLLDDGKVRLREIGRAHV